MTKFNKTFLKIKTININKQLYLMLKIIIIKQTKALINVAQFVNLQICFSLINNESKNKYASAAGLIFVYRGNVGGNNF